MSYGNRNRWTYNTQQWVDKTDNHLLVKYAHSPGMDITQCVGDMKFALGNTEKQQKLWEAGFLTDKGGGDTWFS